jgi:hypothetical protein
VQTIYLDNPQQGHRALSELWVFLKPLLLSGRRYVVTVKEAQRTIRQNALLHARVSDISSQVKWCDEMLDVDDWKRLLMAAWLRARGEDVKILPALDGHGVEIVYRKTSDLTKAECVEFCDYIMWWGTEKGVAWSPTSIGSEMQ